MATVKITYDDGSKETINHPDTKVDLLELAEQHDKQDKSVSEIEYNSENLKWKHRR